MVTKAVKLKDLGKALKQSMALVEKQAPFALSQAINDTIRTVKEELPDEAARSFNSPKPFTYNKNSVFVSRWSKKNSLTASVKYRPKQSAYLATYVDIKGATRDPFIIQLTQIARAAGKVGKDETLVPAIGSKGIRLTKHGNATKARMKKAVALEKGHFYSDGGSLHKGYWVRSRKRIHPVLMVHKVSKRIEKLDAREATRRVVDQTLGHNFDARLRKAIETAR